MIPDRVAFPKLLLESDLRDLARSAADQMIAGGLWDDPNRPAMKLAPAPERAKNPNEFTFNEMIRQISVVMAAEEEDDLKPLAELIRSDYPLTPRVRQIVADMLDPGSTSSAKRRLVLAPRRGAPPSAHPNEFALCFLTFVVRFRAKRKKQAYSVVGELFGMSGDAVRKLYFLSPYYKVFLKHQEACLGMSSGT